MPIKIYKQKLKKTILIFSLFLFAATPYLFAVEKSDANHPVELTNLEQQAREYRDEGLKYQNMGDLESALNLYQKAIELDSKYPVVYNDLGVVYEAKGMLERAEDSYLKAIKADPYYLSTYSNLAIFYENKRELGKAAYCWRKRIELGDMNDPWVQKAKERLEDIRLTMSAHPISDAREREVVSLTKDIANEKYILKKDDSALARKKFQEAQFNYGKNDYATAIKDSLDAQYLDPNNKDIEDFIEKTQTRALIR